MKIGLCTSIDRIAEFNPSDIDYIEENVQSFLVPLVPESEFAPRRKLAETIPIRILAANCFLPATLKVTGPEVDSESVNAYVETALMRAKQVGIRNIVFGSAAARSIPEGFSLAVAFQQLVDHLKRWGDMADEYGVKILVEPLNKSECNIINTVLEGEYIVDRIASESIGLLADFYHMMRDNEPATNITRTHDTLRHVHIAEKANRTWPGHDGDDFRPFMRALRQVDYSGSISMECSFANLREELPKSVHYLREQLKEAGW